MPRLYIHTGAWCTSGELTGTWLKFLRAGTRGTTYIYPRGSRDTVFSNIWR